jgi:hypothetical protein
MTGAVYSFNRYPSNARKMCRETGRQIAAARCVTPAEFLVTFLVKSAKLMHGDYACWKDLSAPICIIGAKKAVHKL